MSSSMDLRVPLTPMEASYQYAADLHVRLSDLERRLTNMDGKIDDCKRLLDVLVGRMPLKPIRKTQGSQET